MATKLASQEISDLDPYKFMAVIGKRVIHPAAGRPRRRCCPERRVAGKARLHHKMAWLMPRMAKAVPYLGYINIAGIKPA